DRRRAVRLGQHRQDARQEHLPQARRLLAARGRRPRAAVAADLTRMPRAKHGRRAGGAGAPFPVDLARAYAALAPERASFSASSWSPVSDVWMTSPGIFTSARIFSMLAWRTSAMTAAPPFSSFAPRSFMKLSSTPASLNAPAAAPDAAPIAMPKSGMKKI